MVCQPITSEAVLYRIAELMDPDPVSYTNCAVVSRLFFRVFTSDHVWRPLNVLEVEKDIIQSYNADYRTHCDIREFRRKCMERCIYCSIVERPYGLDSYTERAWSQVPPVPYKNRKMPLDGHVFAWLGLLMHRPLNMPMPLTFHDAIAEKNRFVARLLLMRPYSIVWLPRVIVSEEFAIMLVKRCGCILTYLSEEMRRNWRVLEAAIPTGCTKYCKEACEHYVGKTFRLNVRHQDPCITAAIDRPKIDKPVLTVQN